MSICFSAGGAGYGDPLEADPEAVAQDIVNQIITKETAEQIYKVVYDEAQREVDASATEALRSAERKARLKRGKPFAEFISEWEQQRPPEEILHSFGSWPDGKCIAPIMRM